MKRLFNNTLISSFDYILLVALNLLATPILITYFGVDGYGAFVFLSIFSTHGALSFFDLGMEGALMNYVARFHADNDRRRLQDSLTVSLVFYGLLGIVIALAVFASGDFIVGRMLDDKSALSRSFALQAMIYIAVNIFLQFLTLPFSAILQGMRRYIITKSISAIMNVLRYLLIIATAIWYGRIDVAFFIIAGLTLVRLAVFLYIFAFRLPEFRPLQIHFNPGLLRTLFRYSSVLFINRLIGLVHNQIDKLLIWLYLTVSSMTVYDVVSRPANLLRLVMTILNSAVIPEVARRHHLGEIDAIAKLYINMVRYAYLAILPFLAVLFTYMSDLLGLWVGEQFTDSASLALILLAVHLVLPIPSIASTVVVGLEKVRQTIWIPITSTVINIVLSLVLLKLMGLAGLLIGTLCADTFGVIPYTAAMKRFLRLNLRQLVRPLVPIGLSSLVFLAFHTGLLRLFEHQLLIIIGATATFILHIAFNYRYLLSEEERIFLHRRLADIRNCFANRFAGRQ